MTQTNEKPHPQQLQALFRTLGKFLPNQAHGAFPEKLTNDCFDVETGTLTLPTPCIFGPEATEEDLAPFRIVAHLNSSIILQNNTRINCLWGLSNLVSIHGNLIIKGTALEHITDLNALSRVKGDLDISGNISLLSLPGLTGLVRVGGNLSIRNNNVLTCINGLNSLQRIEKGNLELVHNPLLQKIDGLISLKSIGGTLHLDQCLKLEDIHFLSHLTHASSLRISKIRLNDVTPLRKLFQGKNHFSGAIKITSCSLQDLSFMNGIKHVGSSLYLHNNFLEDLRGLENLETVGGSLSLSNNKLAGITQLSHLKSVNGLIALAGNSLPSLKGLDKLTSVKTVTWNGLERSIVLSNNPGLKDISSLSGVKGIYGRLIIIIDSQQSFSSIPDSSSRFSTNRITVVDGATAKRLDESAVCEQKNWQLFEEVVLCANGNNCSICRNQKYGRAWRQTLQNLTPLPPGGVDFPCPYGKSWSRYGYVSRATQLRRKQPLSLKEQFRFAERYADSDSFPKEKWGTEIDVVYPFLAEELDSHDELRYSVRSLSNLYEKARVWIVGDKPRWLNEKTAHYIPHTKTSSDRFIDSRAKVKLAVEQQGFGSHFLYMNDDFFIIVPTCAAFLGIPRYFADYTNNIDSFEVVVDYHLHELKGLKALQEKGRLLRNFSLHWPYMHKTDNYLELYNEFDLGRVGQNHETLYYNTYSNKPMLYGGELLRANKVVTEEMHIEDIPPNILVLNSKKYSFDKTLKTLETLFHDKSEYEL